jgi:hypothetical protein
VTWCRVAGRTLLPQHNLTHSQHQQQALHTGATHRSQQLSLLLLLPAGLTTVDLDDVAAAHVLAALLPEATGRYLLVERGCLMSDIAAMLR